jgi:hypothetical protein
MTDEGVVYRVLPKSAPPAAGKGVWVSASARPIRDELGRIVAAVTTLRDITEQHTTAERLRDLSLTDELTGLFNRRGIMTMANARISLARRTKAPLALLYADVNGLKRINDELGHKQGDRTIQDAAHVLRSVFREGDIVARIFWSYALLEKLHSRPHPTLRVACSRQDIYGDQGRVQVTRDQRCAPRVCERRRCGLDHYRGERAALEVWIVYEVRDASAAKATVHASSDCLLARRM